MDMFWIGFGVGTVVGAFVAILALALCKVSGD
jgi:hypothetical protein